MSAIHSIFYWAAGLVFPSLEDCVAGSLPHQGASGVNLPADRRYWDRREALALGNCTGLDFCRDLCHRYGLGQPPKQLERELVGRLDDALPVGQAVLSLRPGYAQYLIWDIPRRWAELLHLPPELEAVWPEECRIFLPESGLDRITPDLFEYLPRLAGADRAQCLFLDADSRRAAAAVNARGQGAVIIGPDRLRREFQLRKMSKEAYCMHTRPQ